MIYDANDAKWEIHDIIMDNVRWCEENVGAEEHERHRIADLVRCSRRYLKALADEIEKGLPGVPDTTAP